MLLLLQFTEVQSFLATKFSDWVARSYEVNLQVRNLKPGILGDVTLEGVFVPGEAQDTLIYIEKLKIKTSFFRPDHLRSVYTEGLYIPYCYESALQDAELYKRVVALMGDSDESNPILIDHFWVSGARLVRSGKDFTTSFENLNLYLIDTRIGSEVDLILSHLNWDVVGGAKHHVNASEIYFSDSLNQVSNFHWSSDQSGAHVDLEFDKKNLAATLKLHQFNADYAAAKGLVGHWPEELQLSTQSTIHLKNDSLWSDTLRVSSNKGSFISGSFGIGNWSDMNAWGYSCKADTFELAHDEWAWIRNTFPNHYEENPLGAVSSEFSFDGSMSDLAVDISLDSDQGRFETDLKVNISDTLDAPIYNGKLILQKFNLSQLVRHDLQQVNAEIFVRGKGFDFSNFDTDIHGDISAITFNDYTYKNIELDGRLQPNYFKGKATVLDRNLDLDFSGEIDFSKELPVMDFVADIKEADLVQLNWYDNEPVAKLSTLIEMNLIGNRWSNIEGSIGATFTTIETQKDYYYFDDVYFNSEKLDAYDVFSFRSDFMNASLQGFVDVPGIYQSILTHLKPHYPQLQPRFSTSQNFDFQVEFLESSTLTKLFIPDLIIGDTTRVFGRFNPREEGLVLDIESPLLKWKYWMGQDLNMHSEVSSNRSSIEATAANVHYGEHWSTEQLDFAQQGAYGNWDLSLGWESTDTLKFGGEITATAVVDAQSFKLAVEESQFYFADSLWTLNNRSLFEHSGHNLKTQISLTTSSQGVDVDFESKPEQQSMRLALNDFELDNASPWSDALRSSFEGQLNGVVAYVKSDNLSKVFSDMNSNELRVNGHPFGSLNLQLDYDDDHDLQTLEGSFVKGRTKTLDFTGSYMPMVDTNSFNITLDVTDFNLKHVEDYVAILDTLEGEATGVLTVHGMLHQPKFEGDLLVSDLRFSIPHLNTQFKSSNSSTVTLTDKKIILNELDFEGVENGLIMGAGQFDGQFHHRYFKDFSLDLSLEADSLLCLNTDAHQDKSYYGRAFASGGATFKGPKDAIEIQINAVSNKGTALYIPLDDDESIDALSFVHFVQDKQQVGDTLLRSVELLDSKPKFTIDMNLELNENAQVNIMFDETLGDKLRATGNGFINLGVNTANEVYMFGDYVVEEGDYLFTLQNFVNKKFEIEKGAQLMWDGSPYDAQMNMNALYRLNTNLSLLTSDTLYNKSRDVECRMLMRGDLLQPIIDFDIQIPSGDDRINRILDEHTNTSEKKTQQFLSLLVLNTFMSTDEYNDTDVDYLSSTVSSGAEVLNNQLYNWTSQFSDRFDLGLKYHPNQGEYLSQRQWELLLNNMKVNDRITFNGNIASQAENTNRFIGDFEVEYQLSDDGKLRLLAFSNNLDENLQLSAEANKYYTTGLGLFYRDEFDDFRDLWNKFKRMFRKRSRE
jgi:hypothetical protein